MTDHELPPNDSAPQDPADARDEAAAAILAVPALDEVTRRRLVGTALAAADTAPATRRRSRLVVAIPVAAAIVLGIAVGSIVVTRPEDPTTTAASPAPSTALEAPAPQQASGSPDDAAAETPALSAAIRDLGDLGDIADAQVLRDSVNESLAAGAAAPKRASRASVACGNTALEKLALVDITAIGHGVDNSAPVVVFVGTDAGGQQVAVGVVAATCDPVIRAQLGG